MAGALSAMIAAIFSGGVTSDPFFEYTTLLLPGNGTNGAQNNTFLDGSTNNFTITRNGNTTQGTFSPFSQTGWGNYFDGTGDYLTVPDNVALRFGTGDFDIEFWYNGIVGPTNSQFVISKFTAGSFPSQMAYVVGVVRNDHPTNPRGIVVYLGSTSFLVGSGNIQDNTWYHIAVTRESGSVKVFINGTQVGTTQTITNDITNTSTLFIGASNDASSLVTGYVSNVRIVKGSAVYTSNFTPPTAPLTAISGTSLLTCQSNRFIDNSTNNFTITRNGDVRVVAFSPFNPTASWSAATYGGSGYFDGSGDYLDELTATTAFNLSTGDWTIEAWIYRNVSGAAHTILTLYNTAGSNSGLTFYVNASNQLVTDNGVTAALAAGSVGASQWVHMAIVRSGGTTTGYINGTSVGTTTQAASAAQYARIGALATGSSTFNGYIANLRIVKGTAVYTGNFTPPSLLPITNAGSTSAASYPSTTNVNTSFASSATSLLLNFTNAGIYDATSKNDLETVANAQISTTQSKWGGSSMYFDGTGDCLIAKSQPFLNLESSNFTIEAWINFSAAVSSTLYAIVAKTLNSGANTSSFAFVRNTSNKLGFVFWSDGTGGNYAIIATTANFPSSTGVWNHVAVTRSGSTFYLFIDGVSQTTTTTLTGTATLSSPIFASETPIAVGASSEQNYFLNGYLQDVRITNYARYTANFTPPTAAFPTL